MDIERGFTLIEVIVTLTIVAVVAAMLLPYLSKTFAHSGDTVVNLNDMYALQEVMENIIADYAESSNDAARIWIRVGGAGEHDNQYGQYEVVTRQYMTFNNGSEVSGTASNVLKVTIRNTRGETLTRLFPAELIIP
jgi:prepilin-type N-terminal cleavage/methylation domain-containing protein